MNYSTWNLSFIFSNPYSQLSPGLFLRDPLKINSLHFSILPAPISIHFCAKDSKVGIGKCNTIDLSVKITKDNLINKATHL